MRRRKRVGQGRGGDRGKTCQAGPKCQKKKKKLFRQNTHTHPTRSFLLLAAGVTLTQALEIEAPGPKARALPVTLPLYFILLPFPFSSPVLLTSLSLDPLLPSQDLICAPASRTSFHRLFPPHSLRKPRPRVQAQWEGHSQQRQSPCHPSPNNYMPFKPPNNPKSWGLLLTSPYG